MLRASMIFAVFAAVIGRGECAPVPPYDPCEAKACGEACRVCAPDAQDCVETMVVKACDAVGACVAAPVDCAPAYDPCAGKLCGDACSTCDPRLGACPTVMMYCDASGKCDYALPTCTAAAR